MSKKSFLTLCAGLISLAGFVLIGCGGDDSSKSSGFAGAVVDSVAASVADHLDSARLKQPAESTATVAVADHVKAPEVSAQPPFNDVLVRQPLVYAAFDGGLAVYDLSRQTCKIMPVDDNLKTLTLHASTVMAGGNDLYQVDGDSLTRIDAGFEGDINDLCSFGSSLMIGTSKGLYSRDILGVKTLLDDVAVKALAVENEEALWVGTSGRGLFRWDGDRFSQRYLKRDPGLFDFVTALNFNHGHLYLGTADAMYVYDGGHWSTIGYEQGLPDGAVMSIDATDWTVYVATNNGVFSYFNDEIKPVERLEAGTVSVVAVSGNRLFASTGANGLVMKRGPSFRILIQSPEAADSSLASLSMLQ